MPNPSADYTIFPITLHKDAEVEIEVWCITGQKIYSEKLGGKQAGTHNYKLNFLIKGLRKDHIYPKPTSSTPEELATTANDS